MKLHTPRLVPGYSVCESRHDGYARDYSAIRALRQWQARGLRTGPKPWPSSRVGEAPAAKDARLAAPLVDVATRRRHCQTLVDNANAERLRREGRGLEVFRDPRTLAKFNKFDVVVRASDEERTTAEVIVIAWSWCRRERGIRVLCGLARAYLLRTRTPHNDRDVWLMALELAVPHGTLRAGVDRVVARQRHCPEDLIRAAAAVTFSEARLDSSLVSEVSALDALEPWWRSPTVLTARRRSRRSPSSRPRRRRRGG